MKRCSLTPPQGSVLDPTVNKANFLLHTTHYSLEDGGNFGGRRLASSACDRAWFEAAVSSAGVRQGTTDLGFTRSFYKTWPGRIRGEEVEDRISAADGSARADPSRDLCKD
ncbi:hypothetical protein FOPE_10885 [Fonsecaea pedrosoi]|nr:hypothetical protein FOPE_10885 [Fonsecaea pedrosoi]